MSVYGMVLLCACLLGFSSRAGEHKFYVSTTSVEHNALTQNMEVTIRLFTHDLEDALGANDTVALRLGEPTEASVAGVLVRDYIRQHFRVWINQVPVQLSFVGRETEFDRTFCYFEFQPVQAVHTIEVENTLLFSRFPEQQNYVEFHFGGWKQSVLLTPREPRKVIYR